MPAAIFFDKDGILNEVVLRGDDISSPRTLDEFKLLDGAREMVSAARERGFLTVIATNQPDIALGRMTSETLEEILRRIETLGFDRIEVCDAPTAQDPRAKPHPGMLLDASAALHIDLSRSYFVGDHSRDMEAGRRAGVKTILLQTTYNTFCHGCGDFNFNAISEIEDFIRSLSNDFLLPSP